MCIEMIQRRKIRNLIDFIIKFKIFSLPFLLLLLLLFYSIAFWIWVPLLKYDTIRFSIHFIPSSFYSATVSIWLPIRFLAIEELLNSLAHQFLEISDNVLPIVRVARWLAMAIEGLNIFTRQNGAVIFHRDDGWWLMGDWVSIAIMYFGIIWINYIKNFKRDILAIIWNKWWYQNVSVELTACSARYTILRGVDREWSNRDWNAA